MAISVVHSASGTFSSRNSMSVGFTPSDGNLLILSIAQETATDFLTSLGWTLRQSSGGSFKFTERRLNVYTRVAASDTGTWTWTSPTIGTAFEIIELSGAVYDGSVLSGPIVNAAVTGVATPTVVGLTYVHASALMLDDDTPTVTGVAWTGDATESVDTAFGSGTVGRFTTAVLNDATGAASYTCTATGSGQYSTSDSYSRMVIVLATATTSPPPDPEPGGVLDPVGEIDADPIPITDYLAEWTIRRGAGADITGGAETGTAVLRLRNIDDQFNPENGSSPLIDYLRDGTAIWVGINNDGLLTGTEPRGLFGGRITDISVLPQQGQSTAPFVEIVAEDAIGWLGRNPVTIPFIRGASHQTIRQLVLEAAGETRVDLADEPRTVALAGGDGTALRLLEELNKANGTRHFAKPADAATDWYLYTSRNRQWRLDATVDATLDDDNITAISGWRLSADTVINQQRATITPITFTPSTFEVWQAETLPLIITPERPLDVWVEFDDYVDAPTVNLAYSGDAPTTQTLDDFGQRAHLVIEQAGVGDATTITAAVDRGSPGTPLGERVVGGGRHHLAGPAPGHPLGDRHRGRVRRQPGDGPGDRAAYRVALRGAPGAAGPDRGQLVP